MANVYDITAEQGATLNLSLVLRDDDGVPINLSGYSISGGVKRLYSDTTFLIDLNAQVQTPESGQILISIPATGTANLPVGLFYYNLFITTGGAASNVMYGDFLVEPTIFGDN